MAPNGTALAARYTGAVHDVLRMMGHDNIVLPPAIKAIAPETRLAGPVWTVSGHIDRTRVAARNAARLVHAARTRPSGHVIVCQPHNHEVALMGELSGADAAGARRPGLRRRRRIARHRSRAPAALSGVLLVPDAVRTSSSAGFRIVTASRSPSAR